MIAVAFAISLYASIVAYANFHTHNSSDVGIVTQAMASTTFGHQAPFYESYDCVIKDRCSFLLVHPGLVLYAAVPFYALAPTSITLFALQAFFVAVGAIPLYWLTRQVARSDRAALFAAGLYLVWAPLFAETAFSLHLETLLPVELLSLAALWQAGRYRWGLLVAVIAFLSFEIAPVFVFLVGLFFLLPHALEWWRSRGSAIPTSPGPPRMATSRWGEWRASLRAALRPREIRYALLLMGCAAAAAVAVYSFMNVWGYWVLGVRPTAVAQGLSGLFYNSSTSPIQSFGTILHSPQTVVTIEYWLILFGLVGGLPFLAPRTFVVLGPWILYTFLTDSVKFSTIGLHTTLVAVGPLFLGVAYGLGPITEWWSRRSATISVPRAAAHGTTDLGPPSTFRPVRRRAARTVVVVALAAVVSANVLFLPINPLLPDLGYKPGAPFVGGYFDNPLTITPGLAWTEELLSHVPRNATIAADSAVFPLLANYPYAIVMEGGIWPFGEPALAQLPFNLSGGPQYVLVQADQLRSQNASTLANLSDPARYGLSGYVTSTAVGPLLLYERGFTGRATGYGPPFPEAPTTLTPRRGMVAGAGGVIENNSTSYDGAEIHSRSGDNSTSVVWSGRAIFLPNGNYTVMIEVATSGSGAGVRSTTPLLELVGAGFGATVLNVTVDRSSFVPGAWTNVTVNLSVPNPVPYFALDGYVLEPKAIVAVAAETIEPA